MTDLLKLKSDSSQWQGLYFSKCKESFLVTGSDDWECSLLGKWLLHLKSQANSLRKSLNPPEAVLQVSKCFNMVAKEAPTICTLHRKRVLLALSSGQFILGCWMECVFHFWAQICLLHFVECIYLFKKLLAMPHSLQDLFPARNWTWARGGENLES